MLKKKNDYVCDTIKNNYVKNIFCCPICKEKLNLINKSLICINSHCFDISKKGCINLLSTSKKRVENVYDDILFKNRVEFIKEGFYKELHNLISEKINSRKNCNVILDMGSGDGTHDNEIYKLLNNKDVNIIGVDISKKGVEASSDYVSDNFVPIVADLNYLPFSNNSIDIILNILSPANESEMNRVLKKDGIILKVTPKKEYLQELRLALGIKEYENENLIEENIKRKYNIMNKTEIIVRKELSKKTLSNLLEMTPLTKNYKKDILIDSILIALNVYELKVCDKNESV